MLSLGFAFHLYCQLGGSWQVAQTYGPQLLQLSVSTSLSEPWEHCCRWWSEGFCRHETLVLLAHALIALPRVLADATKS